MPNRRNSIQKHSPKQFRCTGYGNCHMVFTRSEHLARHERKHTGEKPYPCIVKNCGRMFSRFDNMMQHTQTHEKERARVDPLCVPFPSLETCSIIHHRTLPPLTHLSRRSSSASDVSDDLYTRRRRISLDALQTPIEHVGRIHLKEQGISQDEYEVLEAFSKFCTLPVVKEII
ncbi:hypothetical protein BY458DRAFT_525441 [Sporodiniella umbellata]|nr:hypothetical protein BY458DRAFT_525441 [Sporodiniella umbellata]